ncbi:NAD(P)/FAD-dependent oxidoreductase [Sporichthya polymorpha]|uniref:NAD(P)/FAD-dependent oxidoreductase n=1 Tax=Sporichthya polymorpha TaxID=35751 RepID=UPI0003720DD0|nr:NAD(P)/FAD-dependent oxidoreductase [Sporichthya polymorpha]
MNRREQADVVVVGARVAGSPAAIELARRGRRVVVLDSSTFPSDTLSTHVVFPALTAELAALGALEPLLATGTPKQPKVLINHGGIDVHWDYTPVDGYDFGMCPRRTTLDGVLVGVAREAGAEIREATKVTGLEWTAGRVSGVHYKDREGNTGTIGCKLVIGADGRRSTVASLVGSAVPYRRDENGRGLVFMYVDDPYPAESEERSHLFQWRVGDTLGMYFPTCDNGAVVLFMPPREQVNWFGQDLVHWNERLEAYPMLKERIAGGAPRTKLRKASDPFSYFRKSSGPGWALVGDAGHFKDPVIAQGIRDGVHYGRKLGQAAAAALDDPRWLDRALFDWELARDRECVISYHFALRLSKTHSISPVELEIWKASEHDPERARRLGDAFGRTLSPEKFLNYPDLITWTARGFLDRRQSNRDVLGDVTRELSTKARLYRDLARIQRGKRLLPRNWEAWGGTKPIPPEKLTADHVAPRQPQRSDLARDEGELARASANGVHPAPTLEQAS